MRLLLVFVSLCAWIHSIPESIHAWIAQKLNHCKNNLNYSNHIPEILCPYDVKRQVTCVLRNPSLKVWRCLAWWGLLAYLQVPDEKVHASKKVLRKSQTKKLGTSGASEDFFSDLAPEEANNQNDNEDSDEDEDDSDEEDDSEEESEDNSIPKKKAKLDKDVENNKDIDDEEDSDTDNEDSEKEEEHQNKLSTDSKNVTWWSE